MKSLARNRFKRRQFYPWRWLSCTECLGPAGLDQWEALWRARAFDMARLDAYFAKWHERFDLFHSKRPFNQATDKRAKRKSILYLAEPIANTHTLFNHVTEADAPRPSPAEAARRLLQAQAFRLGGGRTGIKDIRYADSIFARGILFFAVGRNLFDTLVLNLIRYPDRRILNTGAKDRPHWERRAPLEGTKARFESAQNKAKRLSGLSHLADQQH